ncbi:MAG: hypothetical protein EBV41_04980 [Actinobacteria bacterium]|nr:hypothetical protein [Actinomycetota bacterium]NBO33607.1 hypothetical protein [Actinomycetota bacterium]NBY57200.1 hypothetical protein [Actinomycetota bacterium]NDE67217.1 hypothetical protein [Actinomycetota bacterium]NDG76922.1 hypothetical protein [Acidimicrobiia bacterium]
MNRRKSPPKRSRRRGPRVGTTYKSAADIKRLLVEAVQGLLARGVPVSELTGKMVTEEAGVDKMYVRRFFGSLDLLLLAALEDLLVRRMRSLISSDLFDPMAGGAIDSRAGHAFQLFSHLAPNKDLQPRLAAVGTAVVSVFGQQLRGEFGLSEDVAKREAIVGLLLGVGYLSVGHLMPTSALNVLDWLSTRRESLRQRRT